MSTLSSFPIEFIPQASPHRTLLYATVKKKHFIDCCLFALLFHTITKDLHSTRYVFNNNSVMKNRPSDEPIPLSKIKQ